jgi:hypothetical protein
MAGPPHSETFKLRARHEPIEFGATELQPLSVDADPYTAAIVSVPVSGVAPAVLGSLLPLPVVVVYAVGRRPTAVRGHDAEPEARPSFGQRPAGSVEPSNVPAITNHHPTEMSVERALRPISHGNSRDVAGRRGMLSSFGKG